MADLVPGTALRDGISQADTFFVLYSTMQVMFMTPGLALFYGGLVREKAAIDMMSQNMVALGLMSLMWYAFGFSLSFGRGPWLGNLDYCLFNNVKKHHAWGNYHVSELAFAIFQMKCAILAPILATGALADRMYFKPWCIFLILWSLLVYYPWCHQIWGGGFFQEHGVWDFAGGVVLHTTAGWSALSAAVVLGSRPNVENLPQPHNMSIVMVGTALLYFGWMGFNGGSAMAMNESAITAVTNTCIAGSTAMCVWSILDWSITKKPKLTPMCIGAVAGLVIITPMSGYVTTHSAVLASAVVTPVCFGAVMRLTKAGVDDALDVWGVHGVGGAIGTILVGVLSDPPECLNKKAPDWCVAPHQASASVSQTMWQMAAVVVCIVWSTVMTALILKLLMLVMRVKPSQKECENLDMELHGEACYQFVDFAQGA
eukprot:TRINITY_DN9213_c0_g1_i1.p1 TRINITY_DN9213_c0_g1~~TRINITY_DN9213_c0_g1_i1.p1  ORF type:complete len:428 (-),score=60.20 TRINITY_DN9213_c0_g1_i1:233-1516(-)